MGSSGRHRLPHGPKTLRIAVAAVAGLATVALVAIGFAVTGSGSSSANTKSRSAAAEYPNDIYRGLPDRASRDAARTPIATPTPEPSESPSEAPKKHHKPSVLSRGSCEASYYGSGGSTASGESFNPSDLTAAHKTLPMGSRVRVTNRNNDRSVVVRINDRGPFVPGRCLDLSTGAMRAVGGMGSGVIPVTYEVLRKL